MTRDKGCGRRSQRCSFRPSIPQHEIRVGKLLFHMIGPTAETSFRVAFAFVTKYWAATGSIRLTHSSFAAFNDTVVPVELGSRAWAGAGHVHDELQVQGAVYWPGLTVQSCPVGDLIFSSGSSGYLIGWAASSQALNGGLPSFAWDKTAVSVGVAMENGTILSFERHLKRLSPGLLIVLPITTTFVGGIGFRGQDEGSVDPDVQMSVNSSTIPSAMLGLGARHFSDDSADVVVSLPGNATGAMYWLLPRKLAWGTTLEVSIACPGWLFSGFLRSDDGGLDSQTLADGGWVVMGENFERCDTTKSKYFLPGSSVTMTMNNPSPATNVSVAFRKQLLATTTTTSTTSTKTTTSPTDTTTSTTSGSSTDTTST